MLTQPLPDVARRYAVDQRRVSTRTVASVLRIWRRMGSDFDASWARLSPSMVKTVGDAQRVMADGALAYIPAVMPATAPGASTVPAGAASVEPMVGYAGDGRPFDSLLYNAVTDAKERVGLGHPPRSALAQSRSWIEQAVATTLSDTARQGESLGMGVRGVGLYVRMLVPPSCSRCVVLAGARYQAETAFQRHPGCDCRNVPSTDEAAADYLVSSRDYFDSLTLEQQDEAFGVAGAEAIRNGSDISQVVNARRGMSAAQVGSRDVLTTTEGTTRRGFAYSRLTTATERATDVKRAGQRYASTRRPRLMPETIRAVATDQEDYLRLLRANGYLF